MREPDSHRFDDRDAERYYGFAPDDSDPGAEDRAAEAELQRRLDDSSEDLEDGQTWKNRATTRYIRSFININSAPIMNTVIYFTLCASGGHRKMVFEDKFRRWIKRTGAKLVQS